jgi:integrase
MKKSKPTMPDEWPILVKVGSSTAKIFRTPEKVKDTDGKEILRERYTVEWYEATLRKRLTRSDLAEARAEAKRVAGTLNDGRGAALELSGADRDAYTEAMRQLKSLDVPLNVAVAEYVKARGFNVPIVEAAKSYAESHNTKRPDKSVKEVIRELIEAKRVDGASAYYLSDLGVKLNRFAKGFHVNIGEVTTKDIDDWLRGLKMSGRSRNNFRNCIVLLFNFAASSGYLDRDRATAAKHTSAARRKPQKINPFTPAEMSKLLAGVEDRDLPYIALGGLCGLRTSEIERLSWEDIRWAESSIVISEDTSKQGEARRRRIAPLTIPAAAWLGKFKRRKGRVTTDDLRTRANPISEATGVKWKTNGLRKGFITHRLAELKDFIKVAFEAGNSPAIIRKTYDGVATETEGKLWFSILPEQADNVVPMEAIA